MAFRYRILFYHENQKWVHNITPLLDLPMFHLFLTDNETLFQRQLESDEADIILTGVNTEHFLLVEDAESSISFKRAVMWEVIENRQHDIQVILLCTQKEVGLASDLVQSGKVADYFIVDPLYDKSRLFLSIMKTLQSSRLRDVVHEKVLKEDRLPKDLFECIEHLQILRDAPEETSVAGGIAEESAIPSFMAMDEPEESFAFPAAAAPAPAEDAFPTFPTFPSASPPPPPADDFPTFPTFPSASPPPSPPAEDFPTFPTFPSTAAETKAQTATEEAPSAFPAESVFASLKDNLTGEDSAAQQNGAAWGDGIVGDLGTVGHSWTKMQKSQFDILMLDNNPENIRVIQAIANDAGFKALVAHSAEEGLFYLNSELFSLLILNMDLPDANGLDFLNKLRYKGPQQNVPAIVISDHAQEEQVIKSIKVGANYFMVKPLNAQRLYQHIVEFLGDL